MAAILFFQRLTLFFVVFSEFNEFMDDLEEDPELRRNVNIFKDKNNMAVDVFDTDYDSNCPRITLEEMLDDLDIDDVEMAE